MVRSMPRVPAFGTWREDEGAEKSSPAETLVLSLGEGPLEAFRAPVHRRRHLPPEFEREMPLELLPKPANNYASECFDELTRTNEPCQNTVLCLENLH